MENNLLRTCYNVRLIDRLSIADMHREPSLVSLEQRRKIQLLSLMYIYNSFANVERVFVRNTRQGNRYHFCVENYQGGKYKSSPYFKGTILWDSLPVDIITSPAIKEFKLKLRRLLILETQRRQYEGNNTPLGCYTDQGP